MDSLIFRIYNIETSGKKEKKERNTENCNNQLYESVERYQNAENITWVVKKKEEKTRNKLIERLLARMWFCVKGKSSESDKRARK